MSEKNKNPDIPFFDINETGRVDLTLFKMDTGFLLKDNILKKDHSISKMDDLEATLGLVIESVKEKVRNVMLGKLKFDYVDIGIIVQEGEDEGDQYDMGEFQNDEPVQFDPDQLADIVNTIISGNPLGDFPQRGGHRSTVAITGMDIVKAMNSPKNMIQLKTRVGAPKRGEKTENEHHPKKKHFYDKTKNKETHQRKDDNSKATEIK